MCFKLEAPCGNGSSFAPDGHEVWSRITHNTHDMGTVTTSVKRGFNTFVKISVLVLSCYCISKVRELPRKLNGKIRSDSVSLLTKNVTIGSRVAPDAVVEESANSRESTTTLMPSQNDGSGSSDAIRISPTFLQDIKLLPVLKKTCRIMVRKGWKVCPNTGMARDVVLRLLQHVYECSTDDVVLFENDDDEESNELKCLHISTTTTTATPENTPSGIHWGLKRNGPYHDPAFLIPFLFRDYTHQHTYRQGDPLHYCAMVKDSASFIPADTMTVIEWNEDEWESMWSRVQFCDYLVTDWPGGLTVADSIGCPAVVVAVVVEEEEEEANVTVADYERSMKISHHRIDNKRLGDPWAYPDLGLHKPQHSPKNVNLQIPQAMVSQFPFELFQVEEMPAPSVDDGNKTIVVVIGNLRGGEVSWESLYTQVLDVNSADLALIIGMDDKNQHKSIYHRAKYVWEFPEYDNWGEPMDTVLNSTSWRENVLEKTSARTGTMGGVDGRGGSGAVTFMIRHWLRQRIIDNDLTTKYDRFIVTRSDNMYRCEHDISKLDPHFLWVPEGQDYGGINDRHFVTPSGLVLKAINIIEPIFLHPASYYYNVFTPNAEQVIRMRWAREHIYPEHVKRFPRMMFVCAMDDDPTRWQRIKKQRSVTSEGCNVKYEEELVQTECTCDPSTVVLDSDEDLSELNLQNPVELVFTNAHQRFQCVDKTRPTMATPT